MVAAYKMGMVHERPLVVRRRSLDESDVIAPTRSLEPDSVLEIRDDDQERSTVTGSAPVPGVWNETGAH